jgi:hypothetical protein
VRGYAFEGWNLLGPERTKQVIDRLHAMGIKAILYVRAYVAYDELNSQPAGDLEFVRDNGLTVKDAEGRPAKYKMTGVDAYTLDFTNPRTRAWWKQRLELLMGFGADGFMQDFGEHVQETDRFSDGSTGRTMHNRYPVLYHRMTAEMEGELERKFGRELWWFTRVGLHRQRALRDGQLPRRRDRGVGRRLGHQVARARHAQPRRRRRVRLLDRHRRLPRPLQPAGRRGAVDALARVGGADAVLPPAQLADERHADAVALRRRGLRAVGGARAPARAAVPLIRRLWARAPDRACRRRGRCGSRSPATGRRPGRTSSGCSGPTCSSRPW